MLIFKPPLPEDRLLPRCRIPIPLFKSLKLTLDQWVKVITPTRTFLCRIWPHPTATEHASVSNVLSFTTLDTPNQLNANECYIDISDLDQVPTVSSVQIDIESSSKQQLAELMSDKLIKSLLKNNLLLVQNEPINFNLSPLDIVIRVSSEHPSQWIQLTTDTALAIRKKSMAHLEPNPLIPVQKENVSPSLTDEMDQAIYMTLFRTSQCLSLGIFRVSNYILSGPSGSGKRLKLTRLAKKYGIPMTWIDFEKTDIEKQLDHLQQNISKDGHLVILFNLYAYFEKSLRENNGYLIVKKTIEQLLSDSLREKLILVIVAPTLNKEQEDYYRTLGFDREIQMRPPTEEERRDILEYITQKMSWKECIDQIVDRTKGFSAADLERLCKEAVSLALVAESVIEWTHFEKALEKVKPTHHQYAWSVSNKLNTSDDPWNGIIGMEHVKAKLIQAIEWPLKYAEQCKRMGVEAIKGILMYGPPGCSKTSLAKAVAGRSGISFFTLNGASLYSPYVGDSEKTVRDLYSKARTVRPSIIFIDEIDSIIGGRNLTSADSKTVSVSERVLSALLNEMDGVQDSQGVLTIGATNRPDLIDRALLRPGRFDRLLHVPAPDQNTRKELLKYLIEKFNVPNVDYEYLSSDKVSQHYSGADLHSVVREATMASLRESMESPQLTMQHFIKAFHTIPPSLSSRMQEQFKEFEKEFGKGY